MLRFSSTSSLSSIVFSMGCVWEGKGKTKESKQEKGKESNYLGRWDIYIRLSSKKFFNTICPEFQLHLYIYMLSCSVNVKFIQTEAERNSNTNDSTLASK
jgi:hypothetical protein